MAPLTKYALAFAVAAAVYAAQQRGCVPAVIPPADPDAATYVFEKDQTAPPAAVLYALNRLNRETKIAATEFEADTRDGKGEVPDQYVVPLKAASEAGLPALVVTSGDTVLRVIGNPQTEEQVMEAVK